MKGFLLFFTAFTLLTIVITPGANAGSQRVIYYDYTRQSRGVSNPGDLTAYFQSRGFVLANSLELKQWMSVRIKGGAGGSTVVMAMGSVPAEIVESLNANCTLAGYLKAGGKVVWLGGSPLLVITYPDGSFKEEQTGLESILGVKQAPEGVGKQADITSEGTRWGITAADDDSEPMTKDSAGTALSCVGSSSCSWVKNFNTAYPFSGFVKYRSFFDGKKRAWNSDAYRLALFEGTPTAIPAVQAGVTATINMPRYSFVRGETAAIKISLQNQSPEPQRVTLAWRLLDEGNVSIKGSRSVTISSGGCTDEPVHIQTSSLASKTYEFEASLTQNNSMAHVQRAQLYIGRKAVSELPFGVVIDGIDESFKTSKVLKEMSEHNITHISPHGVCSYPAMDIMQRYGIKLIPISDFYFNSSLANAHPEARMLLDNGNEIGTITPKELCYNHPLVKEQVISRIKYQVNAVKDHPAFSKYIFFDDDTYLFYPLKSPGTTSCYCATCTEKFQKETGLMPPKSDDRQIRYGASGVIPEDDPWLLWTKFRLYEEYGSYHKMLEAEKNKIDPQIKMGPVHGLSLFPFFHLAAGIYPPSDLGPLSLLSSYFYPSLFRQMKDCIYHSDIAFMGNRNNKELFIVTQAHDRKTIVPGKTGSILYGQGEGCNLPGMIAPPGWFIRNQYYNWLAGGATGIIYFYYPTLVGEYGQEAFEEIKNLGAITKSYGALFKSLEREKKDIAVLISLTNNNATHFGGAYRSLLGAHLPVETICEEEIAGGILPNYKVLILDGINYLPKPVYVKIEAFIKQGGRVLIDKSSKLTMPGGTQTATLDQLIEIAGACVKPGIEVSPQQDVVMREFKGGGITYLWLVNTYTDRWVIGTSLYNTPVVPKTVTVDLKLTKSARVYDVLKSKEIQPRAAGNTYNITLDEAGGTLLALYPGSIENIRLTCPQAARRGESVTASIRIDCKGLGIQPVEVKVLGPDGRDSEYSHAATAVKGVLDLKWSFAANDAPGKWRIIAKELTTGKSVEKQLQVK